ncbi:MAG: hypothetical protein JWN67_731 [Actinomycetia bacterium]|nr:hypothetical protein [Actinomycetes bacterium]
MGWDPGTRPDWVAAVNRGEIEPITEEAARPFTRDGVLAEALAVDGSDDGMAAFGDERFLEPLDVLLPALEDEAQLTVLGRWLTRRFLQRLLVGRIQQERYVRSDPGVRDEVIEAPVFVAGAPRTGTTILHALLVEDPNLRAPLGWELLRPLPPPTGVEDGRVELAEAELRMLARVTPTMDAIHEYGARNAKECLSAMSFELQSEELTARYHVPSYVAWFQASDMTPAYERHKLVLQILQRRTGPASWVLKSPVHLHNLDALLAVYPDARLAFTHRDPMAVLASATSLVANLRWVHSDHPDFAEVGRYHVDLFTRSLDGLVDRELPAGRFHHGHYADFLASPIETVHAVYDALGLEWSSELEARMAAHLAAKPQGRHGEHSYSFDDLGVDRASVAAGFARYVSHFEVPTA